MTLSTHGPMNINANMVASYDIDLIRVIYLHSAIWFLVTHNNPCPVGWEG